MPLFIERESKMSAVLETTAGLLEGTKIPWMFLGSITLKLGLNFMKKDMTKKEAVLDALKDNHAKLDEIKSMLSDVTKIGEKTYELLVDQKFRDGIERIAAAYVTFLNVSPSEAAWQTKMTQFENYVFEHETGYNQYMNPKQLEKYLSTLAGQKKRIAKMTDALEFILATEAQYLHVMVHFYIFKEDLLAIERQFQTFNEHVKLLHDAAAKERSKIIPVHKVAELKMTNCPLLFKLIAEENADEVEEVCRHLSPGALNKGTRGSKIKQYLPDMPICRRRFEVMTNGIFTLGINWLTCSIYSFCFGEKKGEKKSGGGWGETKKMYSSVLEKGFPHETPPPSKFLPKSENFVRLFFG